MRATAASIAITASSRKHLGLWVAVVAIALLYVGSTLPTPIYSLYERQFGFSELMVTAIYASYVVGNLAVLFAFGRLSDQIGRRPITLIAFSVLIGSTLCFLFAQSIAWLYLGRILNGVAAGLGAGALTAWIAELEPSQDKARAAILASAGNLLGLALGAPLAGLLAQYAPWPLRTSFGVYVALLIPMMAALAVCAEGVRRVAHSLDEVSLKPRIGVPREILVPFAAPAAIAFAMFALGGFYGALTPGLLAHRLHETDLAVVGWVVGLYFGMGALVAALSGKVSDRSAILMSTIFLVSGLALLLWAELAGSFALLILATLVSGAAMALGYRLSLKMVNAMAPPERRAEVVSAYLLVCYTGNSVPVIGVGLLSQIVKPETAHQAFAAVLGVLAIIGCWIGLHFALRSDSSRR